MVASDTQRQNVAHFTKQDLVELFQELGEKSFRAVQVFRWLYQKRVESFSAMSDINKALQNKLSERLCWNFPELCEIIHSKDGSVKFLLRLEDGHYIESVLMKHTSHYTLCVSSQVGCAMGCAFCLTATMGLKRNLTSAEILFQVLAAEKFLAENQDSSLGVRNLVFMGMGEPLQNYMNLIKALKILTDKDGFNFAAKRITVSTVGLLPRIEKFLAEPDLKVNLAISLNASNQEDRQKLMPVAKSYHLDRLFQVIRQEYQKGNRERLMLEYILIDGVSDGLEQAKQLVGLCSGVYCKVNLIAYNENSILPYKRPSLDKIYQFQKYLLDHGILATQRHSKGQDIMAACGQLALNKKQQEPAPSCALKADEA